MADGVVRACQVLEAPVVPHLPVPVHGCMSRGGFSAARVGNSDDAPSSPLHGALEFNTLTPNPSQPSGSPPTLHVHGACAAVVLCCVCGVECGPDMQYGKCGSCLDAAFNAFTELHVPNLALHYRNSSPAFEGTVASTVNSATLASSCVPPSPKRARRHSPPHRKAGPPK